MKIHPETNHEINLHIEGPILKEENLGHFCTLKSSDTIFKNSVIQTM